MTQCCSQASAPGTVHGTAKNDRHSTLINKTYIYPWRHVSAIILMTELTVLPADWVDGGDQS
jgi:hypothetical protein